MTTSPCRVLIVFASSHGQTRAIAERIGEHLRADGAIVEVRDAGAAAPAPEGFDGVVIGSRVELGRHARPVLRYIRRHRTSLERTRTAFFSVSMSAAGQTIRDEAQAAVYLDSVVKRTGWRPGRASSFAGALRYTKYNPLLRLVMRRISQVAGHPTETSRDHEFTDWGAVRKFAEALAADLGATVQPATAPRIGEGEIMHSAAVHAPVAPVHRERERD
jgi:menaquinone-dependent protoporphyrinogen oxidase